MESKLNLHEKSDIEMIQGLLRSEKFCLSTIDELPDSFFFCVRFYGGDKCVMALSKTKWAETVKIYPNIINKIVSYGKV